MTGRDDIPENSVETRLQAEMISRGKEGGSSHAGKSLQAIKRVVHKLQVHQLELEMKNIELRLTQTKHDATKERYFDLYEQAPVGYCVVNEKGLIFESNLTAAHLLGVEKWELFKQPFIQFVLDADKTAFSLSHKQLFTSSNAGSGLKRQTGSCELRMVKKDGTQFWAWLEATVINDPSATQEYVAEDQPLCRIVIVDISNRKGVEDVLKDLLTEKKELLREVHYQIKNNLANIMVLSDLRMQRMDADKNKAVLLEQNSMLRCMLLAHEHLYQSDDYSRIDFQSYIEDVIAHIRLSYERSRNIVISVDAKAVEMDLDSLLPCGLFVTELVTNALKFAFPESRFRKGGIKGEITVSVDWDGLAFTLVVADNGVGLPTDMDWTKAKTTGLLLVRMLGERRLNGRIIIDRTHGTSFRLRFVPRS